MKLLNLGSLNFDKVYDLHHFVTAGETMLADGFAEFLGGKGLNQSLALARAGADVTHVGAIGPDGKPFLEILTRNGVDVRKIKQVETVSGHAIIQSACGQNCIVVYGGANQCVDCEYIDDILSTFETGDLLLLQNETSNVGYAIAEAKRKGMLVAFNASPITQQMLEYPLEKVDYFLINEVEGKQLAATESNDYMVILEQLVRKFPHAAIVLTLGSDGAIYRDANQMTYNPSYKVSVVDTTAAGDTFTGFFLASIAQGRSVEVALRYASAAGALAVSKKGAANSIPKMDEVQFFLENAVGMETVG